MRWKLAEPRELAWLMLAAVAAAAGAAALTTTIVGRERPGTIEFFVVGVSIAELAAAGALGALAVLLFHGAVAWTTARRNGQAADCRPCAHLRPLILLAVPAAGVGAAMIGGRYARPLVYAFWELGAVWVVVAAGVMLFDRAIPSDAITAARGVLSFRSAAAPLVLIGWILAGNALLRTSVVPTGDEPRYLRHAESWYQGRGADISQIEKMQALPAHQPPRVHRTLGLFVRAALRDSRTLVEDVWAWTTRSDFVWHRAHDADGAFLTGPDGGVYQTYQPGLPILFFPGYVIDRWTAPGTMYLGQFPDRLYGVYAILLVLVGLAMVAIAALCRQIVGATEATILAGLSLAALPVSSLALQIYPETAACAAIAAALAALVVGAPSAARAAWSGFAAGYLSLLHARFLPVAVVLLGFALYRLRWPRAAWFAGSWLVAPSLQVWYVYHATGVPWPTAFYSAAGIAPLDTAAVLVNLVRYALDRDWGFLAHAPLFVLAAAGMLPLWRVRRDFAIVVPILVVTLMATASAHTLSAAGTTPDRLIAAVLPLLILPVAAGFAAWRHRPFFRIVFICLVMLTLVQAWDYNRWTPSGLLDVPGISGWRINGWFPYLSEGIKARALPALAGIVGGIVVLTAALLVPWRLGPTRFQTLRPAAGVVLAVVMLTTVTGAWGFSDPRYLAPGEQARNRLVAAYVRAGTCALCWSSELGPIAPESLGPNGLERLALDARPGPPLGAAFRLTASGPDGPVFGVVRFDFGDGQISPARVMAGSFEIAHAYPSGGPYTARAWLERPGERAQAVSVRVEVGR